MTRFPLVHITPFSFFELSVHSVFVPISILIELTGGKNFKASTMLYNMVLLCMQNSAKTQHGILLANNSSQPNSYHSNSAGLEQGSPS